MNDGIDLTEINDSNKTLQKKIHGWNKYKPEKTTDRIAYKAEHKQQVKHTRSGPVAIMAKFLTGAEADANFRNLF
eukprot:jgi/Psemu1/48162/gm1.48162_g